MANYGFKERNKEIVREQIETTIANVDNPLSFVSLAPPCLGAMVPKVLEKYSNLAVQPEHIIRQRVKPTERDERIRLAIWDEFNFATAHKRPMRVSSWINSNTTMDVWKNYYLKNELLLVYLITPPANYESTMKLILNAGLRRMLEIIELPIMDDKGKINTAVVTQILKTFQLADMRIKGSIIQQVNINQKSLNVNTEIKAEDAQRALVQDLMHLPPDEIDELERKVRKAAHRREGEFASLPEARQVAEINTHRIRTDLLETMPPLDIDYVPSDSDELIKVGPLHDDSATEG